MIERFADEVLIQTQSSDPTDVGCIVEDTIEDQNGRSEMSEDERLTSFDQGLSQNLSRMKRLAVLEKKKRSNRPNSTVSISRWRGRSLEQPRLV